jgi:hypothetical protein
MKGIAMHFSLKKQTALLMAVLFVLPANVIAGPAPKANAKPVLRNVELTRNGEIHGRVLDIHGKAVADTIVQVSTKAGSYETKTDKSGQFTVADLKGGNCVVKVDEAAYGARLWKQGTAPPKSLKSFSVVNDPNFVVRGQDGMLFGLTPAQLLGLGLVAGGIVAIAIAADDDDGS